jgi:hypothetical protein
VWISQKDNADGKMFLFYVNSHWSVGKNYNNTNFRRMKSPLDSTAESIMDSGWEWADSDKWVADYNIHVGGESLSLIHLKSVTNIFEREHGLGRGQMVLGWGKLSRKGENGLRRH